MTSELRSTFFALCLLCVATGANAQEPPEFETTVREALEEFQAGRWTESRTLFLAAHRIRPSAEALRMAGNASYEAREYVRAVELLEQALAEARSPLREDRAALAREALAASSRFVTRLDLVVPEGARVQVDGVARSERPLVLPRGEHLIEVAAVGFEPRRERLVLSTPEHTATFELRPVVAPDPTERDVVPDLPEEPEPEAGGSRGWIWAVVGVVAAGAIAGLAVGLALRDSAPAGANAPGRVVRALEVR